MTPRYTIANRGRIAVAPKADRTWRGVLYASKAERLRAEYLDELLRLGELIHVVEQPTYRLGCAENRYRPDFMCVDKRGEVWVEDVKGMETQSFRRHVMLWKAHGPCPLHVVKLKGRRWETSEIIEGGNSRDVQGAD